MIDEPSYRQGILSRPANESALAQAIDAGDPADVAQAMRGLQSAPPEAWAAALSQAWERKRTDLVMRAITPDRLVDAIATNHGSLVDWWLGQLIVEGAIEPVTEFAPNRSPNSPIASCPGAVRLKRKPEATFSCRWPTPSP